MVEGASRLQLGDGVGSELALARSERRRTRERAPTISRPDTGGPREIASPLDFDELYETYFPYVWRILARMGVPSSHLEDASQDVFVVAHRQLRRFEGRASPKTWLFSIAFRVAKEWLRRVRRIQAVELPHDLADEQHRGPLAQAVHSQTVALLYELLGTLSPDKRAVFILGELEQMSVPEIALALEANVNTVASRLRVARREFAASLRRHRARETRRTP